MAVANGREPIPPPPGFSMSEKISSGSLADGAEGLSGAGAGSGAGGVGGGTGTLPCVGGGVSGSKGRFGGGFIIQFTEYRLCGRICLDLVDYTLLAPRRRL